MVNPCDNSGATIKVNSAILNGALSGVAGPAGPTGCPTFTRTFVINEPTEGKYYLTYSDTAAEIKKVVVLHAGATPGVTWNIYHGTNYAGVGTALLADEAVTSSIALGNVFPDTGAFAAGADEVAANSHIWVVLDDVDVGTDTFIINLMYKPECVDVLTDKGIYIEDVGTQAGYIPVVDAS